MASIARDVQQLVAACPRDDLNSLVVHKVLSGEPMTLVELVALVRGPLTTSLESRQAFGASPRSEQQQQQGQQAQEHGLHHHQQQEEEKEHKEPEQEHLAVTLPSDAAHQGISPSRSPRKPPLSTCSSSPRPASSSRAKGGRVKALSIRGHQASPRSAQRVLVGEGQPKSERRRLHGHSMASVRLSPAPEPSQSSSDVASFRSGTDWLKATFSPVKIPDAKVLGYKKEAPDAWSVD
jgi:hypothetical protein